MATYTVKPGDSWFRIAGILYGDQRMAGELQAMNAGIDVLQPGMKIKIPDKPAEGYVPYIAPGQMEAWFGQAVQYEWMTPEEQAGWVERYLELAGPEGQGFGISEGFAEYLGTTGLLPGTEPVADEQFGLGTTGGPTERPRTGRGPGGAFAAPGPAAAQAAAAADLPAGTFGAPTGRGPGGVAFGPKGQASPGQYAAARRREAGIARGLGPQPPPPPPQFAAGPGMSPEVAARRDRARRGEAGLISPYPPGPRTDIYQGPMAPVGEGYYPTEPVPGVPPLTGRGPGGRVRPPGEELFMDEAKADATALLNYMNTGQGPLPARIRNSTLHMFANVTSELLISLGYEWNAETGFWVLGGNQQVSIREGGGGGYGGYVPRGRGRGGRGRGGGYYQPHLMGLINWRIG